MDVLGYILHNRSNYMKQLPTPPSTTSPCIAAREDYSASLYGLISHYFVYYK